MNRKRSPISTETVSDLLFAGSGGFYSRLGNGDGTFRPAAALTMFSASFPTSTAVGDLNGDGKADVVWSHAAFDGVISVYLGNGDGTFRETPSLRHPHDPNGWGDMYGSKPIAIADFNRDGKADLAVLLNSGYSYASVAVLNGQGDGEFEQGFSGFTLVGAGISASDFNADGNLDIASGPSVLLGNGDGSFQVPAYFPGDRPMAAALAEDFNGDGLPDLVLIPSFLAAPGIHFDPTGTGPDLLINNSPGNPASVAAVSSVNGAEMISPGSLASIYGSDLATGTASPTPGTAPTALGGIRLRIHDSSGETEFAKLVYVSPTQINFVVPEGAATGWSIFTIDRGTEPVVEGTRATLVTDLAPGFFTVDGRLNGVAAATAIRIGPDGQQEPVEVFSCNGSGSCTATPLDLRNGAVYLTLYGTGFRRVEDPFCLVLTGNRSYGAITSFSGPHPFLPGLDQVNLLLPPMIPSGLAWVECTFDPLQGPANSNAVQVAIK